MMQPSLLYNKSSQQMAADFKNDSYEHQTKLWGMLKVNYCYIFFFFLISEIIWYDAKIKIIIIGKENEIFFCYMTILNTD